MIKLLVLDLDGTLLNPHHVISPANQAALAQLHQQGVQLAIATGRHYQDVYLLTQQLNLPITLITSNGARVHNPQQQLIYENHIPAELVAQVLALSAGFAVHRNIYQQDLWLVEQPNEPLLAIHHASGFAYRITDFAQISHRHIDKFYFNASPDALAPLQARLEQQLGDRLYITYTTDIYLEVMNQGVSKGAALQALLTRHGLDPKEVMAFGDGLNDVDMLQLAGHPVMMANAHAGLKQACCHAAQAPSNAEDGVARYLHTGLLANQG
ncbi:haloacid dehalogenase [Thiomicrospira aerophila AL3]|uniref:Haloacid dehalogenase n=1 Tax=Thiomicrospira aerophila AL3 TaxID=717772 RepID=W0DTN3_9GAMM|nr:Cof-type HAD-IIB family hydrolase [Thiomicrospira aerophila]AHF01965.1 haloacid dehalogenase [Thiomicrospira aerophila AL3]